MAKCPRCGKWASLWGGGLRRGLCRECRQSDKEAAQAQRREEARQQTEQEENWNRQPRTQRSTGVSIQKCPCCGGSDLVDGKLGPYKHAFVPPGRIMFVGYVSQAFVCLDCGFLGHCLADVDIQDLQRRREE